MKRLTFLFLAAQILFSAAALSSQSGQPNRSPSRDDSGGFAAAGGADALALMHRALVSMGGASGWRATGAASTDVTYSMPNGQQKHLHWADDWSATSVMSRRELVGSTQGSGTVISYGSFQTHTHSDGTKTQYPRDPDIATLAVGYPGEAVLRTLQRPDCTVSTTYTLSGRWPKLQKSDSADGVLVYAQCIEPTFIDGRCNIVWLVDTGTGTLRGAWLPVRGMLNGSLTYEFVRYNSFSSVGGLSVPSSLTITRPNGRADQLNVDPPAFTTHLPPSVFGLSN